MNTNLIRLLNIEPIDFSSEAREILQSVGHLTEAQLDRNQLLQALPGYDVLITRLGFRIDEEIMAASELRAIVTATTGLDHIDLGVAEKRGIEVLSLRGETEFLSGITSTAEHTWGLLLALMRRIPWAFDDVRLGGWQRDGFTGHSLKGLHLGIIGYGRLGRMVARYGVAFGMRVLVTDRIYPESLENGCEYCEVNELLKSADVITLHVPLNASTRRMIGTEEIAKTKRGCVLINTSRGPVVDELALLDGLRSRQISAAAMDVLADEIAGRRSMSGNEMISYAASHDNLLITPHIGGASVESMRATEIFMAKKLREWLLARSL